MHNKTYFLCNICFFQWQGNGSVAANETPTWLEVMWTRSVRKSSRTPRSPQIKQHSLSVKCRGPKTAKPEENEPPRDPRRGWQDKTVTQLRLKETRDNEIIFNLCPSEALPTPVILDGIAREGGSQFHVKPGNYCANYSLRCGVITGPGSGEHSSARAPAEAGAARWWTVVPLLFPSQIFDLLSCLQSVLLGEGGGEAGEKQPQTFNCSTETGVRSTGLAICSARIASP